MIQHSFNNRMSLSPSLALPPPSVTIRDPPITMAGNPLTLVCYADVISDLVKTPTLQWVTPNGTTINTGSHLALEIQSVYSSTLSFTRLHTSDAGQYSCWASINISGTPLVQSMESTIVTILGRCLDCNFLLTAR